MRHLTLERWSQGSSPLHRRDPRAKLAVLLGLLAAIATTPSSAQLAFVAYASVLVAGVAASHLPVAGVLLRATLVLPFTAVFAMAEWWQGDPERALALIERSYLSGLAGVLFVATTPLPAWAAALSSWRVPRALVLTIQFLYRYLFLLAEQAHRMRLAARCRGGSSLSVGVLFARSWERATGIHRAMLSRGFNGRFPAAVLAKFRVTDAAFLAGGIALAIAIRVAA